MSQYLDFEGLSLYDKNVKKRISGDYYNKDEVDNLLAGVETNILWKDAVATYADIAITYPYPKEGWTVNVLDTAETYRYDGDNWVKISASAVPKATESNDGLMPKEMYSKVQNLGTASSKDFTTTLDQSVNLPTSTAVQTYVNDALTQLNDDLLSELALKVGIDDIGDASEKDYADEIPEETEKIEVKGEWFSYSEDTLFYLEGSGVDNGIDMSFFEKVNNYTLHFNLVNYSSPVEAKLHVVGTKTDPDTSEVTNIDTYYQDGDVLVWDDIPDEYLDGSDSGAFEIILPDYELYSVEKVNFLIFPVFHDEANEVDIEMIDTSRYENERIIHQEYDVLLDNHVVTAQFGLYSSSDLPTATAVSSLVRTVTDALKAVLEAKIDEVNARLDEYEEASDDDIESLFGGGVSDYDIENLFSV